jgi:arsenate reductase
MDTLAYVPPAGKVRVLFLCTHNSARSQMAEGIMRHLAGDRVEVESAGSEVTYVRPEAIATMADMNIDISGQRSKHLREFLGQHWDYVVTVCDRANESCPVFPGDPERIHWSFDDPSAVEPEEACKDAYLQTAIELTNRIRTLLSLIERNEKQLTDR